MPLPREFESASTTVESGRLSLRIHSLRSHGTGGGLPVVILPGLGASCRTMLPPARLLPPEPDVFIVDPPAHGESERPPHPLGLAEYAATMAAWLNAQGLERAAWVGHSFGSQVLVELASGQPELADRLVLISPTVDPSERTIARQFARLVLDTPREPWSLLGLLARDYLKAGLSGLLDIGRVAIRDRVEEKLPSIAAPTLVIRGSRDPLVPERWAEEVVTLLPHGELVVIPGGTHAVQYESPEAVAQAVQEFLEAQPPFGEA
jgi:2-hydroxy-6-oxonona-2,4-dienedioate hydrolase